MALLGDSLIGQLFLIGVPGYEVNDDFRAHFKRCPSGGFILFGRNIRDQAQVAGLTAALSALAAEAADGNPPIIAVDQEGGSLSPLRGLVTSLPGNMGLAAAGDPRIAGQAGYLTGRELRALGINTNLAPVLDLAGEPLNPAIGTRSFGQDPQRVAAYGTAYAEGLLKAGALFAAKHFPGHGCVVEDSHLALPVCRASRQELLAVQAAPFRAVAGLPRAAIMAAHVRYDAVDPERPASLSRPVVTGVLREEFGFDGVVLTDCLEMGGLRQVAAVPEAAVMAIVAGCDLVLISHTPALQEAAFAAVREAVRAGRISLDRLEQSAERIRGWKEKLAERPARAPSRDGIPPDLGVRVLTFVPGDAGCAWRFCREPLILVTPAMDRLTPAEDALDLAPVHEELAKHGLQCARVTCAMEPDRHETAEVLAQIEEAWHALARHGGDRRPRVALVIRNSGNSPGQAALGAALADRAELLLIGIRDPREARPIQAALARRAPALFTFSTETVVLSALAKVLAGEETPKGVMPVAF